MVILKNPRSVRLMDRDGRFDLKPGEEVEFESVPKDLKLLVKKGILVPVRPQGKLKQETSEEVKKTQKTDGKKVQSSSEGETQKTSKVKGAPRGRSEGSKKATKEPTSQSNKKVNANDSQ